MDFARARQTMVDTQLITSSVTDRRLLAAMRSVPRERFVPEELKALAYIDRDLALTREPHPRYLPAPAPFARLVQLARIGPDDRVLDVGCATGYSTAVIAALCASVAGVESDATLAAQAAENLQALGLGNANVFAEAPSPENEQGLFDAVIIEGVLEEPSPALLGLLREHGRLVALIGNRGAPPVAHLFVKTAGGIAGRAEFNARMPSADQRPPSEEFVF